MPEHNAHPSQSDYTMELRLCDDAGMVSDTPVEPGSPGTRISPDLTYLKLHNNLAARNRNPDARKPWTGPPFVCTGSAHLAGEHIRCTSPAHADPTPAIDAALRLGEPITIDGKTYYVLKAGR